MQDIEFFDHTADVGFRLARPSLEELFRDAAFGMFDIVAPGNVFQNLVDYEIAVRADELEELLVNWLSELNFYFQVKGYVPVAISVELQENRLSAKIQGSLIDLAIHQVAIEIKAVTFHKIYVRQENNLWHAQVIFDI